MADDKIFQILLQIKSDQADLQKLIGGLKDTKGATEDAAKSAFSLGDAFKFAGAEEVLRRTLDLLKQIPERLYEAVKSGVEFNAELQNVQTGLATLLLQSQSAKFVDFAAAKEEAGTVVELLKDKANELGKTYTDMFEGFEHAQLSMSGITGDIREQISLYVALSGAMSAMSISGARAAKDTADLFRGMAQNTAAGTQLAASMHMTVQELDRLIQAHIQAGDAYAFFTKLFSAFKEGSLDAAKNATADWNRFLNIIRDLEGEMAQPLMQPLISGLKDANSEFAKGDAKAFALTLGDIAAGAIKAASALGGMAEKVGGVFGWYQQLVNLFDAHPVLMTIVMGPAAAGLAFSSMQQSNKEIVDLQSFAKQFQLVTDQVHAAKTLDDQQKATAATGALIAQIQDKILSGTTRNVEEWKELLGLVKQVYANLSNNLGSGAAPGRAPADNRKQLEAVQQIIDDIALKKAQLSGDDEAIAEARAAEAYDKTLKILIEKNVEEKEAIRLAEAEYKATFEQVYAKSAEKDEQRDVTEFTREQALALEQLRNAQQLIKSNPFLTQDQKDTLSIPLITTEINDLNAEIAKGQALMDKGTLDPAQYDKVAAEVDNLRTKVVLLGYDLQKLSFGGALQSDLTKWASQFSNAAKDVAQVITGTLNTAINSTSQALTGLIFGTKTWQQAFAQAAQSIVQNLIQIALQYVVSRLIMAAINAITGQGEASAATSQASAAAAAWAPAAVSASIASYGAASGAGIAAYLAALASGEAVAVAMAGVGGGASGGHFKRGGFTGSGSDDELAGAVHKMEYVFGADAVKTLGVPFLERLHHAARGGRMHAGGIFGEEDPFYQAPDWGGGGPPSIEASGGDPVAGPPASGPTDSGSGSGGFVITGYPDPGGGADWGAIYDARASDRATSEAMSTTGAWGQGITNEGGGSGSHFLHMRHSGGPIGDRFGLGKDAQFLLPDEVPIIGQTGEFMHSRAPVQHYGIDVMRAINEMRIPVANLRRHHAGGELGKDTYQFTGDGPGPVGVGGGPLSWTSHDPGPGGGGQHHFAFFYNQRDAVKHLETREGKKWLINLLDLPQG